MARYKSRRRNVRKRRPVARRKRVTRPRTTRAKRSIGMSTKRILNVTSVKKRDTMMPFSNTTVAGVASGTFAANPLYLLASSSILGTFPVSASASVMCWAATARSTYSTNVPALGTPNDQSTRSASNCYMRGLSEVVRIRTNDATSWKWRRICFEFKPGANLLNTLNTETYPNYLLTSVGMVRTLAALTGPYTSLYPFLFRGTYGNDWTDPLEARVDGDLVTLRYDKIRTISSNSGQLFDKTYKMWYPMNKTLFYADDEIGGKESVATYNASLSRKGMGDYMVIDIIQQSASNSTTTGTLCFEPQATLYWHEK